MSAQQKPYVVNICTEVVGTCTVSQLTYCIYFAEYGSHTSTKEMSLCREEIASTDSLVSAESTELLQARIDICDLKDRVSYLEQTLQTVH